MTKRARVFALAVTAWVIATATLTPGTQSLHPAASIAGRVRRFLMDAGLPYRLGPLGFEFLANIAMFIPLGVFLGVLWWGRWRGLLFAVPPLVSLGIETFQFLFLPHRGPQFEDIIANSLGGWIGLAASALTLWLVDRSSEAKRTGEDQKATLSRTSNATTTLRTAVFPPALDVFAWGITIVLTSLIMFNFRPACIPWRGEFYLWLVVAAIQVAVGWLLQFYPAGQLTAREQTLSLVVGTLGVGTIGWVLALFGGPVYGVPRSLMFAATPLALMVMLSARYVKETALAPQE